MNKKITYDQEKMEAIRLAGLMSEEDEEELGIALGSWNTKKCKEIYAKYINVKVPEKEVEDEPDQVVTKPDSMLIYNQFRKTLKVEVMKEDVLEAHDHKCFMCKHKYPSKDDFKKKHKGKTYPLFVRCLFNVPRYIEVNRFIDIQDCLDCPDLRNSQYYIPMCLDCKPSRFAK